MFKSWYYDSRNQSLQYAPLDGDYNCDVAILGGGETGLSAALFLVEQGYKVALVEKEQVGWGASGRNGGQFIIGYSCSLAKLVKLVGKQRAKELFWLSVDAISLLKKTVAGYAIDCDLKSGYYHAALNQAQLDYIDKELALIREFGYEKELTKITGSGVQDHIASQNYCGLLQDKFSGHLHPLNLTLGLAQHTSKQGLKIFENSAVTSYKENSHGVEIKTTAGRLKAKHFIIAGNAYLAGISSKIERYLMPVGTYIAASEVLPLELADSLISNQAAVADLNFVLDYYRLAGRRMLYGGRVSYSGFEPLNLAQSLYQRMITTFPQLTGKRIDYAWGGKVAITMNRAPYFGRINRRTYFATGYSGHGVGLSLLAGWLIAKAVAGDTEKFDLFTKIKHWPFPGGRLLRTPALVLAMNYFRIRDKLGI